MLGGVVVRSAARVGGQIGGEVCGGKAAVARAFERRQGIAARFAFERILWVPSYVVSVTPLLLFSPPLATRSRRCSVER